MRSVRRDVDLLSSLEFSLFAVDKVAERTLLYVKRLGLVEMDMIRRRSSAASSYSRVRVFGSKDLSRGKRVLGLGDKVRLERSIEKVPAAVRVNFGSYDCHAKRLCRKGFAVTNVCSLRGRCSVVEDNQLAKRVGRGE